MEERLCPNTVTAQVLRVQNCFQMVNLYHGFCGWNDLYCVQVLIIGTMCFINAVLLVYLLFIDLRNKVTFTKIKTWILISGLVMNLIQFTR